MYRFNMSQKMPCTADELLNRSMRNFEEYAQFAPNVKKVDVLSRETAPDGREVIVVRVFAEGWLPPGVSAIFKMKEVSWKECYTIDARAETKVVDWKIETPVFAEYVDCKGTSYCKDMAGGCEITIKGDMSIGLPPVKGIPGPLVSSLFTTIEPFIGKMVSVNLNKYFENVRKTMEKEKRNR